MLPAYLSNVSALVFGGGRPIDGGLTLKDGKRLLGNGKTWRGLIIGSLVGIGIGIIQGLTSIYIVQAFEIYSPLSMFYYLILPFGIIEGAIFGFCLGTGALLGDICGSFIKRRLNIQRGKPAIFLDQLDFVIGALVLGSIVFVIPLNLIIIIIILTFFLHILTNIIAYLLGIKDVWY
jgi:CDP-2,3-bis-(O-geranylgeranyl)-sn-glycerol synthase